MSFAYLVVAYQSGSDLPGCLDAIQADRPDDATIIVVDNASPDNSADVARQHPSQPEIVASARNLGFGGGCNLGIATTTADTIFLVNPDARVLPGATTRLRRALADEHRLGVVAPRIVDPAGESRSTAGGAEPSFRSLVGHFLLLGRIPFVRRFFQPFQLADADVEGNVDWVSGGAMMLRRTAFDAVSGFDERWFLYMEDVDLCRRIRGAGWTVRYVPDGVVEHAIGGSQSEGQPRRWYLAVDDYLRLYHGGVQARLGALIASVGLGLRWAAYRRSRPLNAKRVGEGARTALSVAIGRHQGSARSPGSRGHDPLNTAER
jgi:GT2 family glycosyltransferase